MTLTDIQLDASAGHALDIPPGERMFFYLLSGEIALPDGRTLATGDVAWIAVDELPQILKMRARSAARLVAYSGLPIDEPSIAHGPFVMTTEADIRQAYADLSAGRLLA